MEAQDIFVDERWEHILSVLPGDLEESARSTGSIERLRNVRSAGDMLRVMLAYDVSDLSLKDTAAWAKADNIANFTGPALFYRLDQSQGWLQHILAQLLLQGRCVDEAAFEIRIVDATVITGPGSTGTDWVLHTVINPVAGRFESVEITDAKGAESFLRHSPRPDELVLGDRAYGTARGIDSVVSVGAHPVVRVNRRTLKVCDLDKQRIYLQSFEADLSLGGLISLDVLIPVPPDLTGKKNKAWDLKDAKSWIPARIVGCRTDKDVTWVLTTVSRAILSDEALMNLYRVRWQIELLFKRLKSLLHLDALPSRDGPTAKSWLLIRLLVAAIAQILVGPSGIFSPRSHRGGRIDGKSQRVVPISSNAVGTPHSDPRQWSLDSCDQDKQPRHAPQFQTTAKNRPV
jgi:hypothetical protein